MRRRRWAVLGLMNLLAASVIVAALACLLLTAVKDRTVKVYPVEGKVLVNGRPAGGVSVAFRPLDPAQPRVAVGVSGPDGSFRLMTLQLGDGAPEGRYDVTACWPDDSIPRDECDDTVHDRLKQRYTGRGKSGLHAEVRPGTNVVSLRLEMDEDFGWSGWSTPRRQDVATPGR